MIRYVDLSDLEEVLKFELEHNKRLSCPRMKGDSSERIRQLRKRISDYKRGFRSEQLTVSKTLIGIYTGEIDNPEHKAEFQKWADEEGVREIQYNAELYRAPNDENCMLHYCPILWIKDHPISVCIIYNV